MNKMKRVIPWAALSNIALLYGLYMLCRIAFVTENWDMYTGQLSWPLVWRMTKGGLMFDTSAICYTNLLYLVFALLPLHWKERDWWHIVLKWIFVTINSVCLLSCLVDTVYFPFGMHRATILTFNEFGGNTNLGSIFLVEVIRHWYITLLGIAMVAILVKCYRHHIPSTKALAGYYTAQSVALVLLCALSVAGMRGGVTTASRPIAVGNAHQFVEQPLQTGIVLNTPFSMIRTIGKNNLHIPEFFSQEELDSLYSPVHIPRPDALPEKRNICVLIVESFAQEFIGALNRDLDGGTYRGYTEFADSLLPHCLTFEQTIANADISIDAIPAVTASIPRLLDSFATSPYALNRLSGLAGELRNWGYETAFFHGAENSSMGFQAVARSTGYESYYGRTEYCQDPRFNGDKDFDGTWAIWDEPFLQFFAAKMDEMPEPFCTTVFTASSHHPFALPEQYINRYKEEGKFPLHKCVRYADNALRRFFDTARTRPWYNNTVFVIVADHASSRITHDVYKTAMGRFRVPILFYDPQGKLPTGIMPGVAQQIDIMPTLLGIVGYDRPYVAFGRDLLHETDSAGWAFNYTHVPQYVCGNYMLQFSADARTLDAVYDYVHDPLMQHDIKASLSSQRDMERKARAFMQSCYERLRDDNMTYRLDEKQRIPTFAQPKEE